MRKPMKMNTKLPRIVIINFLMSIGLVLLLVNHTQAQTTTKKSSSYTSQSVELENMNEDFIQYSSTVQEKSERIVLSSQVAEHLHSERIQSIEPVDFQTLMKNGATSPEVTDFTSNDYIYNLSSSSYYLRNISMVTDEDDNIYVVAESNTPQTSASYPYVIFLRSTDKGQSFFQQYYVYNSNNFIGKPSISYASDSLIVSFVDNSRRMYLKLTKVFQVDDLLQLIHQEPSLIRK